MPEAHEQQATRPQQEDCQELQRRIRELEQLQHDASNYHKKMQEKLAARKREKIVKK